MNMLRGCGEATFPVGWGCCSIAPLPAFCCFLSSTSPCPCSLLSGRHVWGISDIPPVLGLLLYMPLCCVSLQWGRAVSFPELQHFPHVWPKSRPRLGGNPAAQCLVCHGQEAACPQPQHCEPGVVCDPNSSLPSFCSYTGIFVIIDVF